MRGQGAFQIRQGGKQESEAQNLKGREDIGEAGS